MSSEPFVTEADYDNFFSKKKPEPATVPTIRFDLPPLTSEAIVKSVSGTGGPWRNLQDVYRESLEDQKAQALDRRYGMTPIPEPDGFFDTEDLG